MNNIITKKYDYMLNQLFIVLENVKTNESSNQPGKQQPLVPMNIKGVQDTSKKLLDSTTNGWLPECIDNIEPQRETDFKMTKENDLSCTTSKTTSLLENAYEDFIKMKPINGTNSYTNSIKYVRSLSSFADNL